MENFKKDTESLYRKQLEVNEGLEHANNIIVSYKVPYYKEKLLNGQLCFTDLKLRVIIELVHDMCWRRARLAHRSDRRANKEEELKDFIKKNMIPFPQLWDNDEWLFWGNRANDKINGIIEYYEEDVEKDYDYYSDSGRTYITIQNKNGYLPVDKKEKIISIYNNVIIYYDQYQDYVKRYELLTRSNLTCIYEDISRNRKIVNGLIDKIKKVKRINKLDQANKKLQMSKMEICPDLLMEVNKFLDCYVC